VTDLAQPFQHGTPDPPPRAFHDTAQHAITGSSATTADSEPGCDRCADFKTDPITRVVTRGHVPMMSVADLPRIRRRGA
jgi:hypothetical protein